MEVSVIMGVYNANYQMLEQAINSILAQTYPYFELIICDDGSTNETYQWLLELRKLDGRIIVVQNQQNEGLASALNHCIEVAQGELLVRQDADDFSAENRIEKLIQFASTHPEYGLISSNIGLFDTDGVWGRMNYPEQPQKDDFLFCVPFMHGAVAMRKSQVLQAGGYRVAKETRRTEDIDLFMRMYANGCKGYTLEELLYYFREDKQAQQRRRYRYRIEEAKVKWKGYQMLGLMPKGVIFALKPLIVGLIPQKLLNWLKDQYYQRKID